MNKGLITSILVFAMTAAATSAQAVPSFARKYDTNCSSCHTAFPQLNKAGRKFKEAGYAFPKLKGEESISDFLHWDEYLPVSAVIVSRPYDKKNDGDERIRAIHEIEVMIAGRFSKKVSGFFELESEDEATNEFGLDIGIPAAWLTYNHSQALNVAAVWGNMLAMDPYDTYSGARRLTRGTQSVIDKTFGGADNGGKLGGRRQSISVFGRPMDNVFYNVGIGGVVAPDHEAEALGENPNTLFARLAVDVMPNVMAGLLYVDGKCEAVDDGPEACAVDRYFTRFGVDVQADIGNTRLMGAWLTANDDQNAGPEHENDAWYLQGQHVFKQDGRPLVVPLVRIDGWETDDGAKDYKAATFNLAYYFNQNIKAYVEYWNQFDAPSGVADKSRFTVQITAAF